MDVQLKLGLWRLDDTVQKMVNQLVISASKKLGLTNLTEHHIRVTDETPVQHLQRGMSQIMISWAQRHVGDLYPQGIIELSSSDQRSAPVIVSKGNGEFRQCINYRDFNKVTVKDAYVISTIDLILDELWKARSKIDLIMSYHQIPMSEESKRHTAFAILGSGLWQYRRMPFGLSNALMTFQRLTDALFGPYFELHVFGYLDDFIIVTDNFDEQVLQ